MMIKCAAVLASWYMAIICHGSRNVPLQMDPICAHFHHQTGTGRQRTTF